MTDLVSNYELTGYAHYLAESGAITENEAFDALTLAKEKKVSYVDYLLSEKLLDDAQVAITSSDYFGLPYCDIDAIRMDELPSAYLTMHLVRAKQGLPLFVKEDYLYIAIVDPTIENLYEIKFLTGHDTRLVIAEKTKLVKMIDDLTRSLIYSEIEGEEENILSSSLEDEENFDMASYDIESKPIVNYVNKLLLEAIAKKSSDIHFECYENSYRIRFRQNGILYPVSSPSIKLSNYILARIKVMSNLDITEHRIPQDGRFKLNISSKRSVDFRVSICPSLYGEKMVLRLLDAAQTLQSVSDLGLNEIEETHFKNALSRSQGMILVTGPTGSGKTVTLYSALNYLNSPEKNISTVEDPVEIPVQGINQVHINNKLGLNFSTVLRSFLRQDPDIIMVGEIRDLETAEIAIKASHTGHLVLSTLHTNSASETISRLKNMGVAPYNLASSLSLIIAQRLIRVLCDACRKREHLPPEVLLQEGFSEDEIDKLEVYTASGCDHCVQGYKSRTGIFEVLPITEAISQIIMNTSSAIEIQTQARKEGLVTLREAGLQKVREGVTSLAELNRVFK